MTAEPVPPPLPPLRAPSVPTTPHAAPARRFVLPAWLIALIAACVLLCAVLVGGIAWFIGTGWQLFAGQAQQALQMQPAVREHIGTIRDMEVDLIATGEAAGAEEFVFRLKGDRGNGRVRATFVSMGDDQEIITDGELILASGEHHGLEDQSANDDEDSATEDDLEGIDEMPAEATDAPAQEEP